MTLATFLKSGDNRELVFEQLPFHQPLYILYSSGTSGKPKCIVHSAGVCASYSIFNLLSHCVMANSRRASLLTPRRHLKSALTSPLMIPISNTRLWVSFLYPWQPTSDFKTDGMDDVDIHVNRTCVWLSPCPVWRISVLPRRQDVSQICQWPRVSSITYSVIPTNLSQGDQMGNKSSIFSRSSRPRYWP